MSSQLSFLFDIEKSIESVHYILNKTGNTDFHKLFKILYFAEQKHLALYGRPITGDRYSAMKNGPVPSHIYDMLKEVKGDYFMFKSGRDLAVDFDIVKFYIESKRAADIDVLSESDVECIDKSIEENSHLSFNELTTKSHDSAWENAKYDMSPIDIAEVGGANNEMLRYVQANLQHSSII